MRRFNKLAAIGAALTIVGLIAGCGATNTGATSGTSTSKQTSNTSNFSNATLNTSNTDQSGEISGNTDVIHLVSPKPNQTIKPGATITISGKVPKEEKNQVLQIILFSGTHKVSTTLQSQKYKIGNAGLFSGKFSIPNDLPSSGTEMQLSAELLVKGGPRVWTTLKVQ